MANYPTETFLQFLRNGYAYVAAEFEQLYAQLVGWLSVEHKGDGTHGTVTADSVTADSVTADAGAFDALSTDSLTLSSGTALTTYAEGTWTPAVAFGGASTGITYSTQSGRYTRIGRIVAVIISIVLTNKGSATGSATITGLPFTALVNSSGCCGLFANMAAGVTNLTGFAGGASTVINLYQHASANSTVLTDAEFTNTSTLTFTATYFV